jgi:hypothetical protein
VDKIGFFEFLQKESEYAERMHFEYYLTILDSTPTNPLR